MTDVVPPRNSTQFAKRAAAVFFHRLQELRVGGENAKGHCTTTKLPQTPVAHVSPTNPDTQHPPPRNCLHGGPVRDQISGCELPCKKSCGNGQNSTKEGSGRRCQLPFLRLRTASTIQQRPIQVNRRAYSAVPAGKHHTLTSDQKLNLWDHAQAPFAINSSHRVSGCCHSDDKHCGFDSWPAVKKEPPLSSRPPERCKGPLCIDDSASPSTLLNPNVSTHQGKRRLNQKEFFCALIVAACLSSLFCLFLLRHKEGNPLTQALILYRAHKDLIIQQVRALVMPKRAERFHLCGAPFLGKLLLRLVTPWFSKLDVANVLVSETAFSDSENAGTGGQLSAESASGDAAQSAVTSQCPRLLSNGISGELSNAPASRTPKLGRGEGHSLSSALSPFTSALSEYRESGTLYSYTDDAGAFISSLTQDEFRELLLAEGGWTYIPHTRHNLPIELPENLPTLPRPGGGRFLRRHHPPDSPPALPWLVPGVPVEHVLSKGRQLLTAESYVEAASALQHAVRDGHLTRAVRLHGQFLYPWKLFTDEERESLRLLADQVRWFPKWVQHHRHSQRIGTPILDLYLPVVEPKFADKYGGPGSPSVNLSQGIRFTWLGHSAALVNIDGLQVLLDPMFDHDLIGSYNEWLRRVVLYVNSLCGSLGGRHRQPPCPYEELPADIDVVILSHNHQDHIMENDVETLCRRLSHRFKKLIWYVPEGVSAFLRQYGCASSNIFEFSWGETRTLSCHMRSNRRVCIDGVWKKQRKLIETYEITFAGGLHWSGRTASKTDHNASLWGAFSINGPRHKFFHGGDTAYWRPDFDEFRKIGNILGPFHLAALPIGAYEPNEDLRYQHVKPHETVRMFKDLRAEVAIGVHWGTLRLSAEEFFDPMLDLECALLEVDEADCRKTHELRHRYRAIEVFLRQYNSQQLVKRKSSSSSPSIFQTLREEKKQQPLAEASTPSTPDEDTQDESRLTENPTLSDKNGQNSSSKAAQDSNFSLDVKHSLDSKRKKNSVSPRSTRPLSASAAEQAEFESILREIRTLMLPMADSVRNASNFQRLLRSLKLQEAGILPNTRTWKDTLLKEGARFQTLFVGQSMQVESSENDDFIWMSRSSGLQHVLNNAPDEHYTFNPLYFGVNDLIPILRGTTRAESLLQHPHASTPAATNDAQGDDPSDVLM